MRIIYEPGKSTDGKAGASQGQGWWKNRFLANQTFIFVSTLLLAIALLPIPIVNQADDAVNDLFLNISHLYFPKKIAPQLAFIPIDDSSVDPTHSNNACLWDRDGWQTRRLWNALLTDMGQLYKPKVVAIDILIRQNSTRVSEQPPEEQTIHKIEDAGNEEFLSHLIDYDDLRSQGAPAPQMVFAYEFPDSPIAEQRLQAQNLSAELSHLDKSDIPFQSLWFSKLKPYILPAGCVAPGSTAPIHHAVRLPMRQILAAPGCSLGPINATPDDDLVYRRIPLIYAFQNPALPGPVQYTPSFAFIAFLLDQGLTVADLHSPQSGQLPTMEVVPGQTLTLRTAKGMLEIPIDRAMRLTLSPRFVFPEEVPAKIPFVSVLDYAQNPQQAGQVAELLHDKVIVLGEGFTGGPDYGNFPLQSNMPRALIHLHALNNLFQNDFLAKCRYPARVLICLVVGLFIGLTHHVFRNRLGLLIHVSYLLLFPEIAAAILFAGHLIIPFTAPMVLLTVGLALHMYSAYVTANRQRQAMREHFASVTSPHVLRLLEESPLDYNRSQKQEATILFSDVEGFTSLSEKLDPDFLAGLINRYLTPMSQIIVKYDGYVDKYAGDGIMALWGVPLPDKTHAIQACRAAWYQLMAARALNEKLPDGQLYRFKIRIGLNSGSVAAGNMGSALKQQYTVMGDEVNLAARLEPTNKDYSSSIILGPLTYQQAAPFIHARKLDKIVVKGRSTAVLIHELLGLTEETPEPPAWAAPYERGLEQMWERNWDAAEAAFLIAISTRTGGDPASVVQLERVKHYREAAPPPNWQGEYVRLKKD